ncbi:extracellular solute-binding protein [Paenibacillus antri]|uniref:Extracellular solute-binding protein n=2 Tax=Paenibacillus antri TaxID=2582848 RepID=A0A5R9G7C7_9BACL|nr:extracellular solute-binding protein [Paenibacillus antri]
MLKRNRGLLLTAAAGAVLIAWFLGGDRQAASDGNLVNLEALQSFAENSYQNYLLAHGASPRPDARVVVEGESYLKAEGGRVSVEKNYEGTDGEAVVTDETGSVTWRFQVEEEGLYHIGVRYFPVEGKSSAIERMVLINGALPFQGADSLILDRVWKDESQETKRDNRDNDLRPGQEEFRSWRETVLKDSNGLNEEPFLFYFPKGENELTFVSLREPMAIDYIELHRQEAIPTYEEAKREYERNGLAAAKDAFVKVQAEKAAYKSSPTLYPIPDHTSPSVEPYSISKIRMNAIGGLNWRLPGEWIEWEIEAPEDGLYQIAFKAKQNQVRGTYSNRKLYIDGRVPFKEAESIPFYYDANWRLQVVGDGNEPYLFHLTKGAHRLKLEVSLGDVTPLIRTVESSVLELNAAYRSILMITSATPDPYRDYQLDRRIPGMVETFAEQSDVLYTVAERLRAITGEKSDKTAVLYTMSRQLREMADDPDTVARRLDQFKINIGSLGSWLLTIREMPLSLDYAVVASPDRPLPKAEKPWYAKLGHEAGSFFYSFVEDYNTIGSAGEEGQDSVTVWIGTGRDQAQVMKEMIDDSFTSRSGIHIDLKLVDMSTLLSATLAGQGPDVAMQIGNADPVNYAMRNASYDVGRFPDYEEVASRFRDSAIAPYRFDGGVYALPEQQTFSMLFYRKDVLAELGLDIPDTWEDVYEMIPELQKRHMEFGLPIQDPQATMVPNETFAMLLFQNDGRFYSEDGADSLLDEEISMQAFQRWSDFYTSYKFPLTYDFMNRFRLGEMPIGIAAYTTYNTLTVAAPEIRGLWDFTVVPGTPEADGTVRRDVASGGTAVMMLESAENKDAAWEFMKWWTEKDTQVRFGREMESLMGAAARYPTANTEALKELPWPVKDYRNLEAQWEWVQGIPEVPGGYFTGRHLDNAFRKVVNQGENPREALYDHVLTIQNEIDLKRSEFGLPSETEVP